MPSTIKTIQELSVVQKQIMDAAQASEAKAIELQEAGDQLGAAKEAQRAIDYAALLDETGMKLNDYKSKLDSQIRSGSILTDDLQEPGATLPTTSEGINQKLQEALSVSLGGEVDVTTGLGVRLRRNLAFLQPASKEEYLKTQFPPDRVVTKNVMGSPVTMVQDDNGKWSPIDEFQTTGKDFMDAAGEIFPLVGSAFGGMVGAGVQRSPIGATTGAAAGYTAAGTFQDVVARKFLKAGETWKESLPRRATEAAVSAPIDYLTMKLGVPIARGIARGKKGEVTRRAEEFRQAERAFEEAGYGPMQPRQSQANANKRANLFDQTRDFFTRNGYTSSFATMAGRSVEAQEKLMRAAQRLPNSKLGQDVLHGAKRIERFMDDSISPGELSGKLYDDTLKALQHEHSMLVNQVAISDEKIATQLRKSLNEDVYRLVTRPAIDEPTAAKYLRTVINDAKENAKKAKDEIYNPFYERANSLVSVEGPELARVLEDTYFKGQARPPEIARIIQELKDRPKNARIIKKLQSAVDSGKLSPAVQEKFQTRIRSLRELAGPLNASQMDDKFRQIRDLAPTGPIAGTGATELKRTAKIAENVAQQWRDDVYRNTIDPATGRSLYQDWRDATVKMEDFQEYTQGFIPGLIEMEGRYPKLTSRELLGRVFSDPDRTQQVLTAIQRNDPQNFMQFKTKLQESYLNKIGLNGHKVGSTESIKFDEGIIRVLFGSENNLRGEAMVSKMRDLAEYFNRQKIDPSKLMLADIQQLEGVLSKDSIKEIVSAIGQRAKAKQEIETLTRRTLIKDALNGHRESIIRGEFPAALFDAPPDEVMKIFGKFSPKDQKAMRSDYMEHLFARYPGNPDSTVARLRLFDGQRLIEDARRNPRIRANIETVIGKRDSDLLFNVAKLTEATRTAPTGQGFRLTGVVTQGQEAPVKARAFAPIQAIVASLGDMTSAALYRSGDFFPLMRTLGQKELTEEQYNAAMGKALNRLLLTSQGIQALTETGKYEPEWAHRLGQTVGWMAKEVEFGKEFGIRPKPKASE